MGAAWIAVIGTLGGVALTALSNLLSARLTASSQQAAAASQRLHEARNKLRDERRAAFVTYLSAYQALYHRAVEKIEAPHTSDDRGRFGDEERGSFSRAYQELLITADRAETVDAARAGRPRCGTWSRQSTPALRHFGTPTNADRRRAANSGRQCAMS